MKTPLNIGKALLAAAVLTVIGVSVITLLGGCSPNVAAHEDQPEIITTHDLGWAGNVYEIKLADGTLCAVYSQTNKGAITCNWRSQ